MVQIIRNPTEIIKIVPRDGEIEITLNVNISLDGAVQVESQGATVTTQSKKLADSDPIVPEFTSGAKIDNFRNKKGG